MAPAGAAAQVVQAVAGRIVVNLLLSSDDLLSAFSAGAKVYLDSASSEAGSYSNVTSTAIVSGTEQYELSDLTGTTSTWYKARVGNSGGTTFSDYGDAFQATSWGAYATLQDILETMALGAGTTHHNLLADLLWDVTADLERGCHRTFLRVPQVSGTVTVYLDVVNAGHRSLARAVGAPYTVDGRALDIVSITTLKYRSSESESTYTAVAAGDTGYYLDTAMPGTGGTDIPYEDVTLSPSSATITTWPTGRRAVEVVGALGWPRIPRPVKRGVIDEVRERFRQSVGGGPIQVGVSMFGQPVLATGHAQSFRELVMPGSPFRKSGWVA